jgi:hypothetical protein
MPLFFSGTNSGAGCQIQQYNLNTGFLTVVTQRKWRSWCYCHRWWSVLTPQFHPGTYTVGGIALGPRISSAMKLLLSPTAVR